MKTYAVAQYDSLGFHEITYYDTYENARQYYEKKCNVVLKTISQTGDGITYLGSIEQDAFGYEYVSYSYHIKIVTL